MRFGQSRVEADGSLRGALRQRKELVRWCSARPGENAVGVGQAGVGARVRRIDLERPAKVRDSLLERLGGALIEEVPALEVVVVRFRIDGVALGEPRALCRQQATLQTL